MSDEGSRPWWSNPETPTPANTIKKDYTWVAVLTVAVAVFGLVMWGLSGNPSQTVRYGPDGVMRLPASLQALSSGCRGIKTYPRFRNGFAMISDGTNPTVAQPLTPPRTVTPGEETRTQRIIDNLRDGVTYIFYKPSTPPQEVEATRKYVEELHGQYIMEEWDDSSTDWATKHPWKYVAWGKIQECALFQPETFEQFTSFTPPESKMVL